jgi:hypothetical protein
MHRRAVVLERFGEPLVTREFPVPAAPEGSTPSSWPSGSVTTA